MSRRVRRRLSAAAPLLLVILLAAGCSSDGFPESYEDPTSFDEATGLFNVEANWLEGCEVGLGEDLAQSANAVCACAYSRIKADIPFEDFIEVNSRLKDDPESLKAAQANPGSTESALLEIVKNCIASS